MMIIAGPCSMDEYFIETCLELKKLGVTHLRAGLFKPRSSDDSWSGMGLESEEKLLQGLNEIKKVKELTGLKIVAEAMSKEQIDILYDYIDVYQIGARSQTASELLKDFGRQDKPVILKRGMSTRLNELIMYTSYITNQGNPNVILCERGIRTFENATRNTFDISAIAYLKQNSPFKVIADPSHGTGIASLVEPVALAALAAGADGIMIEVHVDPSKALTDAEQTLNIREFKALMKKIQIYLEKNK